MTKISDLTKRLTVDENGGSLIEYTVLLGVLLTGVILIIQTVGTWIVNKWTAINSNLPS
jgi:Flp pilus assembly pilin Flp